MNFYTTPVCIKIFINKAEKQERYLYAALVWAMDNI